MKKTLIGILSLLFVSLSLPAGAQEIELKRRASGIYHSTYQHTVSVASVYPATPDATWAADGYRIRRVHLRNTGTNPVTVQVRVRVGDATAAQALILTVNSAEEQALAAGDSWNLASSNDAYRRMDFYFKAGSAGQVEIDISAYK